MLLDAVDKAKAYLLYFYFTLYKTFKGRTGRFLNVLCIFSLRPV